MLITEFKWNIPIIRKIEAKTPPGAVFIDIMLSNVPEKNNKAIMKNTREIIPNTKLAIHNFFITSLYHKSGYA